ncbi:MAG TPA: sigma factor-like helix-turn-helix DNA-binding protein [Thermoanaerobaculia bacterium]|nr:sigma factor-like helix-turn-helix DNA-binding protein [Thermoanaerobaculia bacterium]
MLEAWDVVTRALAMLTDREIAVFVRRLEGATEAAIAEALNISTGQVDSDLKRVVAVLARPESG